MKRVAPELYTKEYYLTACGGHSEFLNGKIPERLMPIYDFCMKQKSDECGNILDIGFGRGELAHALSVGGYNVVAVDYSQDSYDIATSRFLMSDSLKFICGDICDIQLDGKFDIFILADVVEHMYDEQLEKMFDSICNEWMSKRAYLCVNTPFGQTIDQVVPNIDVPGYSPSTRERYFIDMHVNVKRSAEELLSMLSRKCNILMSSGELLIAGVE